MNADIEKTNKLILEQSKVIKALRLEVSKILVGQEHLMNNMLIALITGGHILLEGVPGLAKTTAVKTLAAALGLKFQRISFTPDLLPADVIGTMIYNQKEASFIPKLGPVFTNILLADEINRAPAKVQSALLESMQEFQVTIGSKSYPLPEPFFVMATQNPIEQEGTYPLPEAQIDRFMLKCKITHPSRKEEQMIMNRFTKNESITITNVVSIEQIQDMRAVLDKIYCDDKVSNYILDLVFSTRTQSGHSMASYIEYGASPRATLYLNIAARANAMLVGRAYTTPQDVKEVAHDVLRHRIIVTYEAEAENISSDNIITRLLNEITVP